MPPIIEAHHLSKSYRIGLTDRRQASLLEVVASNLTRPIRNFRTLNQLGKAPGDSQQSGDQHAGVIWALKDISFAIESHQLIGLIGPNGSGKSTLLKILSRITRPTSGRATVRGRIASLLEVGTGFHPELTGRENVYLNGTLLGMRRTEIDQKFDQIVNFSEVEQFIDTPVKRYSSGMQVRLAFAVAAHLEPEILIVDEVLAVGDLAFQNKSLQQIKRVSQQGGTILFVSHNLGLIKELCTHLIWLDKGIIRQVGPTNAVTQAYLHAYWPDDNDPHAHQPASLELSLLDGSGKPMQQWGHGEQMIMRVTGHSEHLLTEPAIDVLCYSMQGTCLFAIQSDTLEGHIATTGHILSVEFVITNPGLAVPDVYFDIGLRTVGESQYQAIQKRAAMLPITVPEPQRVGIVTPMFMLPAGIRPTSVSEPPSVSP